LLNIEILYTYIDLSLRRTAELWSIK